MLPLVLGGLAMAGCDSTLKLMPTPALYTNPEWNPFADVPPGLQSNLVSVLYVTDRVPKTDSVEGFTYGHERSRSAAFGVSQLRIGGDMSWDELVSASRTAKRKKELEITTVSTRELGRLAPTPTRLVISDAELDAAQADEAATDSEAQKAFVAELEARLAQTPRKEVFLFVHGHNNTFEHSIATIGEIWHFLGREGVPIAYSWPAGLGALFGYEYTDESGKFTVYHLKQTLRLIASCPSVRKVHVIAHSRGTDVFSYALLETYLETKHENTRREFKFGHVVLAAADMDVDVVIQRMWTARVSRAVESVAIYLSPHDKALAFSNWLFGGQMRLGDAKPDLFDEQEVAVLRTSRHNQFIDADVTHPGAFGHTYFHTNPAVSSDLIMLMRYNLPAGGEYGRPLTVSDTGFWMLEDDYPGTISREWLDAARSREREPATTAPGAAP